MWDKENARMKRRLFGGKFVDGKSSPNLLQDCIRLASADPQRNILLLADLYHPHLELSEVYVLTRNGATIDFSTLYRGFSIPSIVLGIKARTKRLLLENMLLTMKGRFMCICEPGELSLFKGKAEILEVHNEYHMILEKLGKAPKQMAMREVERVKRSELWELDEFYRDNGALAWHPIQFESGPYFCVKKGGRIVSAAGVHFVTPFIAQLGNIMTARSFRRRGYGTLCTYALTSELILANRILSLFVVEDNDDAIRIYERIGFRKKRKVAFASLSVTDG